MTCKRSFKTKSGTFTLYNEKVELCEAKLRCTQRGEILAPFSNKKDANKILKLFKSNIGVENCKFHTNVAVTYFVGLDIKFTEGRKEMVFSDGVKWNDTLHSEYFKDYIAKPSNCPVAVLQPIMQNDPFATSTQSRDCKYRRKSKYICLKPRRNKAAKSITGPNVSTGSELPSVFFVAFLTFFVGLLAGMKIKNRKCIDKKESEISI